MAVTVYWSPWHDPKTYAEHFLSYLDPVKVLDSLKENKNSENKLDNFFNCPAFVNSVKNTYLFSAPADADIYVEDGLMKMDVDLSRAYDPNTVIFKQPSLLNSYTIRYNANYIFFAEEELYVHSTPPYLHRTEISNHGYYVPGTMDISSWFRPLEYAYQMWPGHNKFKVNQDDPLMYVNFLTDENIKLKKFFLTPELAELSMSCVRLKYRRRERNLLKLYEIFKSSKIRDRILTEIKKNLL